MPSNTKKVGLIEYLSQFGYKTAASVEQLHQELVILDRDRSCLDPNVSASLLTIALCRGASTLLAFIALHRVTAELFIQAIAAFMHSAQELNWRMPP